MAIEVKSPMMLMFNKKGDLYIKRDDLVSALDEIETGAIKSLEGLEELPPKNVVRGLVRDMKEAFNNIKV